MTSQRARGTFETTTTAQPPYDTAEGAKLSRMTIAKAFVGDFQGTALLEMLAAMTDVKGSAGYVALERLSGTLHGRTGTFVMQHSGTMTRGAPSMAVSVVPDSATDQLKGLSGAMKIDIVDGKHFYTFD